MDDNEFIYQVEIPSDNTTIDIRIASDNWLDQVIGDMDCDWTDYWKIDDQFEHFYCVAFVTADDQRRYSFWCEMNGLAPKMSRYDQDG